MKTAASVFVIVAAAFFASCLDGDTEAQSNGGVPRAEFDALLARVAALEADRPGDKVFAARPASIAKAEAAGRQLGTALQFNVQPQGATEITLRSSPGYLYTVGLVGAAGITGPTNHTVFYDAAGCSGQGYTASVSDYGAEQGYVFTVTAAGGTSWDDPAQFYYVAAGTKNAGPLNYASSRSSLEECDPGSGFSPNAFPTLPNDPAVTGVENSAITLPITLQ